MEPDKGTPEFITEIILTHMATHYNYEHMVSLYLVTRVRHTCVDLVLQNVGNSTWLEQILSTPTCYGHNIAGHVLSFLSQILNRRYPKVEDITESELLEWKMWPSFLGMIGRYVATQMVMY